MLHEKKGADGEDTLALQVKKIEAKVIQAAHQQGKEGRVKNSQYTEQDKKIDRVKEAEANVRNGALDRLQFPEVAKHPGHTEVTPALDVEQVVVDVFIRTRKSPFFISVQVAV